MADPGAAHPRLRGDQASARLGRALRLQHARPERDIGAPPGGRKLLLRQWVQRAWTAAIAGGRPRRRRVDRLWRLPQPRPAPLRLRAGAEEPADLGIERGIIQGVADEYAL